MSCNKLKQFGLPLLDKGTAIPLLPGLPPPFREVPIRLTEDCLLQPPHPVLQDSLNVHIYSNSQSIDDNEASNTPKKGPYHGTLREQG